MNIAIGSWGIPLLASGIAFGIGTWKAGQYKSQGDYDFGGALVAAFCLGLSTISSLVFWLIWALAR